MADANRDAVLTRMRRLFIPVVTAAFVFLVTYLSSWVALRGKERVYPNQDRCRYDLITLSRALSAFYDDHNRLPMQLEELQVDSFRHRSKGGDVFDVWGRPFQYTPGRLNQYELYSFGFDGKVGGAGLDADLYSDRREGTRSQITLSQYFSIHDQNELLWFEIISECATIALFSSFVVWLTGRRPDSPSIESSPRNSLVEAAKVAAGAIVIGCLLLFLHIGAGH